jgi:hypothetical protein
MWRPTYLVGLLLGASTLLAPVVEASLNLNMTEVLAMFPDCAVSHPMMFDGLERGGVY